MTQQAADPTKWFTDLVGQQQGLLSQSPDFANLPGVTEWTEAMSKMVKWQMDTYNAIAAPFMNWFGMGQASEPIPDNRFSGEAWTKDPRYAAMARSYLAQVDALNKALEAAPVDARTKGQWSFAMRQITDALSPSNNLMTNPQAQQIALESGGKSLIDGLKLFTEDLAKGRISMTDEGAFEVGENVATTPGTVVFENELFQLIQYTPTTEQVHERPFLMVPPCINKFYILDLQAKNSFVGHVVAQGHTVFLVSWRNVGPEQGSVTWDDYLEDGVLKALDIALDISGADKANTLGFCVGGALLASALAVQAARGVEKAASVTLLTVMLDYTDAGEIGLLIDEQSVAQKEAQIGQNGVLQGRELAQVFSALRANDLIWPYVVNGYLSGQAPPPFDLLYWNSEETNLPGPMFCWYVRNMYLENNLRQPGGTTQLGVPVDLGKITIPSFIYASRADHIVPWKSAYESTQLLGGDRTFVLGASGHIAGVINPPAKMKRNYWVNKGETTQYPDEADRWFELAESVPGSWWPVLYEFLAANAGEMKPAPTEPGNDEYKALEPAPGKYVKEKAPQI